MTCSPVEQYKHFLKKLYSRGIHRNEHKWPPVLVKDFINLLWVNKKGVSRQCARDMREDTVLGRMDRIDGTKTDMDFCDIANTETGQHPQCIIVQGAPGSGKTTFAYEVCKRWGQGKILQQYSMIVLLPLRDKTIQNANTLEDLLTHDSMEIQKKVNRVVKEKAGEGVLLLLEGFDELPEEKRSESSLFMKLICGKILPLATVMVTSRPWATSSLLKHYSHRISQHIEIMGFSKENIKEYISQAFPDADEQEKFQKYLDLYPHMQLSMNIPINCAIVVEVYRSSDSINTTPKTMTQLYKALVMTLLLRYLLSHPNYRDTDWMLERFEDLPEPVYHQLKQISELAYSGMMKLQLIFLNLPSHFETLGLLHKVAELYPHRGQSISYSFVHLTLQEFLAAYHISLMDSKEQERHFLELGYIAKDIRSYLPSRFFGNVLRFLSGLGGLKNADVILTDELEVDTLFEHLFQHHNSLMVSDVLTGGAYDMHVSTLCQWLFEAQDESLIAKVYGTLHRVEKVRHKLAHNMYALRYCIATSQCSWELNTTIPPYFINGVPGSRATDQHLEMLCKGLSAAEGVRGHFTIINLQINHFTSEGILLLLQIPHHLLERLTELDLSMNKLDARACNGLAQMLSSHSLPYIRRVSLEHNPIPSGGCLHLIRALTTTPSLSEVVLPHLSADECRVLMSVDQITVLVLDAPKKDALSVVAFAMQHNTTLKELGLRASKFSQLTISTLCTALSSNSTLHILDLQTSIIPDNGGEYLGAMLTVNATLEKLNLLFVSTSKRGITKLAQSLEHNSTLRELWIYEDYENCVQPLMKKPYIKDRLRIECCP